MNIILLGIAVLLAGSCSVPPSTAKITLGIYYTFQPVQQYVAWPERKNGLEVATTHENFKNEIREMVKNTELQITNEVFQGERKIELVINFVERWEIGNFPWHKPDKTGTADGDKFFESVHKLKNKPKADIYIALIAVEISNVKLRSEFASTVSSDQTYDAVQKENTILIGAFLKHTKEKNETLLQHELGHWLGVERHEPQENCDKTQLVMCAYTISKGAISEVHKKAIKKFYLGRTGQNPPSEY
ncbi:hypothetical protein HYT01_00555 [Candidatus Giovannonibacteria bacterium]|nr:hypothetical protein [Candidatus Giovannonibacteria bacterium]